VFRTVQPPKEHSSTIVRAFPTVAEVTAQELEAFSRIALHPAPFVAQRMINAEMLVLQEPTAALAPAVANRVVEVAFGMLVMAGLINVIANVPAQAVVRVLQGIARGTRAIVEPINAPARISL
jgi:ABC-type branched-subunit amino acid transport system ATPase component